MCRRSVYGPMLGRPARLAMKASYAGFSFSAICSRVTSAIRAMAPPSGFDEPGGLWNARDAASRPDTELWSRPGVANLRAIRRLPSQERGRHERRERANQGRGARAPAADDLLPHRVPHHCFFPRHDAPGVRRQGLRPRRRDDRRSPGRQGGAPGRPRPVHQSVSGEAAHLQRRVEDCDLLACRLGGALSRASRPRLVAGGQLRDRQPSSAERDRVASLLGYPALAHRAALRLLRAPGVRSRRWPTGSPEDVLHKRAVGSIRARGRLSAIGPRPSRPWTSRGIARSSVSTEDRRWSPPQERSDYMSPSRLTLSVSLLIAVAVLFGAFVPAQAQQKKPNIVIIWGDDIGQSNISAYTMGLMGFHTPNIDRIAKEGMIFTDYYAEQSCTAGRASFITGQSGLRTGLTKVGLPGATLGLQKEDPTIAEMLKPLGYATGQFGKNHLGDRNEFLPTVHGFDEFYGNLYHLNAEEEPELPDYPKDPEFKKRFGPRGVLHCVADGKGGQTIEDTGPLTKKRMETVDEEITDAALAWMEKQAKAQKPFFLCYNSTAMHFRTHLADKNRGKSGQDDYSDRMVTHDEQIGQMLDKLDQLGIADNTIVMYSTDNGPENDTWPDGANTPFRSQKDTNWEGAWRVPCFIRWPFRIVPALILTGQRMKHGTI